MLIEMFKTIQNYCYTLEKTGGRLNIHLKEIISLSRS